MRKRAFLGGPFSPWLRPNSGIISTTKPLRNPDRPQRLYLYNRGLPCGAKAILLTLNQISLLPLPSESTIKRILAKNGLTHNRTGFYP
jgi:hypothetical protein